MDNDGTLNSTEHRRQSPHNRWIPVLALNIAVLSVVAFFFVWIDGEAINSRIVPPMQGDGNAAIIHRVSRQQDVYPIYKTAGLWGVRVIHLNRFFNMSPYSPVKHFSTTLFPLRIKGLNEIYNPAVDSHNWLFIATRTGLVRSMTTVLPDQAFGELLKKTESGGMFTVSGGTIKGYTYDIPRTITTLDVLPEIKEPVVMNVDAGYFSGGADPSRTAAVLKKQCKDVRMLVLIDSVDEPEVTEEMRGQLRLFDVAWRTQL